MTTNNLEATIAIDATPERVWAVVSDLSRMPEWSPQCRVMRPLGAVREGTRTVNINRQGWKWWPTTAKVVRFEPNASIAFRVVDNRSVWSFDIAPAAHGATLTQRRTIPPQGTTWISRKGIDALLGGADDFDDRLVAGMNATLAKIKDAVERG